MHAQLSIIIPVYNARRTLRRTVNSLEIITRDAQSRVQVVAINDGSTDDSLEILKAAESSHDGFEWRVLDQPNGGLSVARNAALAEASGEWVFFLDSDDELACDPVSLLKEAQEYSCIGCALEYWKNGKVLRRDLPSHVRPARFFDVFSARNPFQPSSVLFRRDLSTVPFQEDIDCVNDWLFWMENRRIFERMLHRPEVTIARIHIHGSNMSSQYERHGHYRNRVADQILEQFGSTLTRKQSNNFRIQSQIGSMQEGRRPDWRTMFLWPCNAALYAKMCAYWLGWLTGRKASPY